MPSVWAWHPDSRIICQPDGNIRAILIDKIFMIGSGFSVWPRTAIANMTFLLAGYCWVNSWEHALSRHQGRFLIMDVRIGMSPAVGAGPTSGIFFASGFPFAIKLPIPPIPLSSSSPKICCVWVVYIQILLTELAVLTDLPHSLAHLVLLGFVAC